ncbi:MBL fold metallo-hydrolase [Halorarius litoreus]|uniref:MBL fold metallo-hydrolase n=1 Tax=Halorarius litoreus TaxID=2962676 RepID=UPI0020CD7628|nr:MBL fold metallo-hydrolase [Halorarius litoreus]
MPEEILDGVYDITCGETQSGRIRAFLFADGTLVDTGLPDTTSALLDGIAETAVAVDRVVITHTDGDHIGGLDAVVETYTPEVYLPVGSNPDLASTVDRYYADGDTIGSFVAVHMPGHRGHQHVLVDEDAGVAVLADALSGADQRGLPAGYFHLPPGRYTDDLNRAEESLEKLLEFEFDAGLVYHGSSVLEGASEKLATYVF